DGVELRIELLDPGDGRLDQLSRRRLARPDELRLPERIELHKFARTCELARTGHGSVAERFSDHRLEPMHERLGPEEQAPMRDQTRIEASLHGGDDRHILV